jgi:hypothetical protein
LFVINVCKALNWKVIISSFVLLWSETKTFLQSFDFRQTKSFRN